MIEVQEPFEAFVARRFGGKLYEGAHSPDGKACLHEALNVYRGQEWSDDTSGTLDLRGLNDAPWSSDEARTAAMVPVGPLVLDWPNWSADRRQAWARRVAQETIRRVLPLVLRAAASVHPASEHAKALMEAARRCEQDASESAARSAESAARSAAWAAWAAWAESAARSAESAARSAESAARSAAWAAWSAAWAAWAESAESAAESAAWAARAAWSAAWTAWAAESAADEPLRLIATIFLEAAEATA